MDEQRSGHAQGIIDQTEIEIAEDNMVARNDIAAIELAEKDQAERQLSLGIASKYLDGQEYDLNRITIQAQDCLMRITQELVRFGRLLLAVKAAEGHGRFLKWLNNNFPFTDRAAQYYMHVARTLEQRPELAPFTHGGVKKAVALLDLPEDYQTEYLEKGSIDGEPLEKYLYMSHKELQAEVKKLKNDTDKIVAEETKTLTKERDMLVKENDRLKKFEPKEEKDPEWCLEQVQEISRSAFGFLTLCRKFMIDERMKDDLQLQTKIEQLVTLTRKALREFDKEWNETFNSYEG